MENIAIGDLAQTIGIVGSVITGLLGYGRLQQQVTNHDGELEKRVTKDGLLPFQEEVLRRLERIERNQDKDSV